MGLETQSEEQRELEDRESKEGKDAPTELQALQKKPKPRKLNSIGSNDINISRNEIKDTAAPRRDREGVTREEGAALGKNDVKSTRSALGNSLRTARFGLAHSALLASASRTPNALMRSLTRSLRSSWERD